MNKSEVVEQLLQTDAQQARGSVSSAFIEHVRLLRQDSAPVQCRKRDRMLNQERALEKQVMKTVERMGKVKRWTLEKTDSDQKTIVSDTNVDDAAYARATKEQGW